MRELWITADDYGLGPGINEGIEELAAYGAITSVAVMTHAEAHLATLDRLVACGVRLGPHLVFVEERACLPRAALGDLVDEEGRLPPTFRALFARLARRPWLLGRLVAEAHAQLRRYVDRGGEVTFITSHQHVHLFPPVYRALAPLFSRFPHAKMRAAIARGPSLKANALFVSSRVATLGRRRGSAYLHPIGLDMAGHLDADGVRRALDDCASRPLGDAVPELVTHPGHDDQEARARYGHWRYAWSAEHEALRSERVREMVTRFRRGAS